MFANSSFTAREKGDILSKVLGSLNTSVVTASMSTALQWASSEKDIELKKLELAKQLDIMDQDILAKEAQVDNLYQEGIALQAQTIRNLGTPTVVDGIVVSLADEGKVYHDIALVDQTVANKVKEGVILDTKEKEAEATVHKILADTYTNYGSFTYAVGDTGLTIMTETTPIGYTTLSDAQLAIAKEQAKGYAYNAWSNALVSSSSTLGTALTSESVSAALIDPWLTTVDTLTAKMSDIVEPIF
jgi:hypothetical protein